MGLRRRPCARGLNLALDFSCPSEDSSPRANRPDRSRTWDNVSGPHFLRPRSTGAGITVRGAPQGDDRATPGTVLSTGVSSDGTYHRYREVVQRREGVWFHHARKRREGLLRASHRNPGAGLQVSRRRRARRVRSRPGPEGPGGAERRQALVTTAVQQYSTALSHEGAVVFFMLI